MGKSQPKSGSSSGTQAGFMNPSQPWGPVMFAPELPNPGVHWNGAEPYLPTSDPDIVLTPFRDDDADVSALAALLNHPSVGCYSFDRPYPYTEENARAKIRSALPSAVLLETLRDPVCVFNTCPFTAIRYKDQLVGDINLWIRGDGRSVLGLAYDVNPDFRGRGIAPRAVNAAMGWAARGMERDRIEAYSELDNAASGHVLKKLGFTNVGELTCAWPELSGGGERTMKVWQRELPTPLIWDAVVPAPAPQPLEIQWSDSGEPFLDIGGGVTITPFRSTDVDHLVALSNEPAVAMWTYNRPTPYLRSDAERTLATYMPKQAAAVYLLRDPTATLPCLPFSAIRDETGRLVGDLALYDAPGPSPDSPPRRELSYALHPDVHGRGIGGTASRAVLALVPRLGVKHVIAYTQPPNVASGNILTKLGFTVAERRGYRWPEMKGGNWRSVYVWARQLAD